MGDKTRMEDLVKESNAFIRPSAEGLIKALDSFTKSSIRVLSPIILPPLIELLGSTANTATFNFFWTINFPNCSINVL